MVTYIQDENGWLNLTSDAYLETSKNPRWSCFWEQLKNEPVNWFQKKTPSQKIVQFNYAWVLRQLNNFNGTNCFSPFRVGISCLICRASAILLFNVLFLKPFDRISKWSMFTFSWAVFSACSYKWLIITTKAVYNTFWKSPPYISYICLITVKIAALGFVN